MGEQDNILGLLIAHFIVQDCLMDWSVLRPHAKYPLLRNDLLYTNRIPVSHLPRESLLEIMTDVPDSSTM